MKILRRFLVEIDRLCLKFVWECLEPVRFAHLIPGPTIKLQQFTQVEAWIIIERPETDPHMYACGEPIFQQGVNVERKILENSSGVLVYLYWGWGSVTLASFTELTQSGFKPKYLSTFWNRISEKFFLTLEYLEISYNIVEYKQ